MKGVAKGDVVLVEDEGPKLKWPLAVVKEVKRGKDGIARAVTVRIRNKDVLRPIQRLRKLEVEADTDIEQVSVTNNDHEKNENIQKQVFTRAGRMVKPRNVLDL